MTQPPDVDSPEHDLTAALQRLGFSSYEARCYVGLIGTEPQTGYSVSKRTGVPQPKVYETLRKLVAHGAAFEVGSDPALFACLPPADLLEQLSHRFEERRRSAKEAVDRLAVNPEATTVAAVLELATRPAVLAAAHDAVSAARRRIYVSSSAEELEDLLPSLRAKAEEGVDIVVIDFARTPLKGTGMRIFRHTSTENSLYRHHQARHLALVVDSLETVNAIAADGAAWDGVRTSNRAVIAAVKGMIRHDIDLQQIYADFGPALVEAYGPGLQSLEKYRRDVVADSPAATDIEAGAATASSDAS